MSADFGPGTTFRQAEGIEINRVPDGAMIYQAGQERVHYLNPTAVIVLELCTMNKTAESIERFVGDAFGLDETPTDAVRACLKSLLDEGLVVACSPSSVGP